MGLKAMVIDDDALIREQVANFCADIDTIDYCLKVEDGLSALNILNSESFDLIFLDLNMPKLSGEELIKHLSESTKVLIISSETDFAVEAFNYNVVGYLLKPFDLSKFLQVISKIPTKDSAQKDFLFVKDGRSLVKVILKNLIYLKSESNYVQFVCDDNKVLALKKLSDLEEELPDNFMRIHRSYIVNLNAVVKIDESS